MENLNTPPPSPTPPPTPQDRNKTFMIIAIVAMVIAVGALLYTIFGNKKEASKEETKVEATVVDSLPAKKDSVIVQEPQKTVNEYGEEYDPIELQYVIANDAYLRTAPSTSSQAGTLKFGDAVYVDNSKSEGQYATVYLSKPDNTNMSQQYYVTSSVLVSHYEFEQYKKSFSLPQFAKLASKTKKLITDNNYSNSTSYSLTQNADRAKYSISYGDFDGDKITDVAVVLDNNEKQTSRLLIICTNAATKDPYLAYAADYNDKVRINSFRKGAPVYMDSDEFYASPHDGLILNYEYGKLAIIFDSSNQKFKVYEQE